MKGIENISKVVDTATAAQMLGVTPRYLRICANAGKIAFYKPLGSKKYVFKVEDVEKALVKGA